MEIPGYQLAERIQGGAHHELHLATSEDQLGHFVIRIQRFYSDHESQRQYVETLETLRTIRHPNLCELVEIGVLESSVYVVIPYYPGGTLGDMLASGLSMAR